MDFSMGGTAQIIGSQKKKDPNAKEKIKRREKKGGGPT
jgi:hypothetical protein